MKTIIAGGRDFEDYESVVEAIYYFLKKIGPISEVVSGHACGADTLGERWAKENGIPLTVFPADWARYGKSAGHMRNKQMAEYADALIAMPGGAGTRNMIAQARDRGLKVYTA